MHNSLQGNGSFSTKFPGGGDGRWGELNCSQAEAGWISQICSTHGENTVGEAEGKVGSFVGVLDADDPALLEMPILDHFSFLDLSGFPIKT